MNLKPAVFALNLSCPECKAEFHFERADQPQDYCPPDHLPRVVGPSNRGYVFVCEFCPGLIPLERASQ